MPSARRYGIVRLRLLFGRATSTLHQKGGEGGPFRSFFTPQNVSALFMTRFAMKIRSRYGGHSAELQVTVRTHGAKGTISFELPVQRHTANLKESVFDLLGRQKLQGHTEIPPYRRPPGPARGRR